MAHVELKPSNNQFEAALVTEDGRVLSTSTGQTADEALRLLEPAMERYRLPAAALVMVEKSLIRQG